jgi:hypothetical protein
MSKQQSSSDQYSGQESEQRFRKLVGIALKSPPKTQKKMARKGVAAQRKKRRPVRSSPSK